MPRRPYSGINTVIYRSAPVPSTTNVPMRTLRRNLTIPEILFRLNASCSSLRFPIPSLLCSPIMTPYITVIIPKPPNWMRIRITICPNTLQVEHVGTVTRPVTQMDVVAVNRASIYGTAAPVAELTGKANRTLPTSIAQKKLSMIFCVVDSCINFFMFIIYSIPPTLSCISGIATQILRIPSAML